MRVFQLRTKIILYTALLVVLVNSGSFLLVDRVVRRQVRAQLVRDLQRSQRTLEQAQKNRLQELVAYATIAAENSTMKAAIDTYQTEHSPDPALLPQLKRTVENEAQKLFSTLSLDVLIVTANNGEVIALEGPPLTTAREKLNLSSQPSILNSMSRNPASFVQAASLWRFQEKTYRIISVPILLQDFVVGTLNCGFEISDGLVRSIKANTNSDIVFFSQQGIIASTLSPAQNQALRKVLGEAPNVVLGNGPGKQTELGLDGESFLTLTMAPGEVTRESFVILNSIDQALSGIMGGIKRGLVLIGIFSILLAVLLGWGLSRSFTRPLMTFVQFMHGITQAGDLKKKFRGSSPNFEVDVLANSFESMARSLEESQAQTARYYEELRQQQSNEEKLRTLATRSRLDALISQVNPHFLFNALNTLGGMIDENPAAAQRLTSKLARIFRRTLQVSEKEFIRLEEELSFIEDYLEIEKARFGDRLQVVQHVTVQEALIPSFTLQPLVENAIKHGAAPKIGTTTIRIEVTQAADRLTLQVIDDGMGIPAHQLKNVLERGYGLRNLTDRLAILYHSNFSWKIESEFQHGTSVLLEIPARPAFSSGPQ
jgi:sensor histidine kinase YesM